MVSVGSELPGVVAIGQRATGIFAVGQQASGVIAVGQGALGLAAAGQLAVGVLWCPGFGVGGTSGSRAAYGLLGRLSRRRLIAWVRREPWDSPPRRPAWRRVAGVAGLAAVTALLPGLAPGSAPDARTGACGRR